VTTAAQSNEISETIMLDEGHERYGALPQSLLLIASDAFWKLDAPVGAWEAMYVPIPFSPRRKT
jgi:hypothetical protein